MAFQDTQKLSCFFCLKDLEMDCELIHPETTDDNNFFSLRSILRYLQSFQFCESDGESLPKDFEEQLFKLSTNSSNDPVPVQVFCQDCSKMMREFTELYHLLEVTKLKLNWCVQRMHRAMSNKVNSNDDDAQSESKGTSGESAMTALRNKMMGRMKKVESRQSPRVLIDKLRPEQLRKHRGPEQEPQIKIASDSHSNSPRNSQIQSPSSSSVNSLPGNLEVDETGPLAAQEDEDDISIRIQGKVVTKKKASARSSSSSSEGQGVNHTSSPFENVDVNVTTGTSREIGVEGNTSSDNKESLLIHKFFENSFDSNSYGDLNTFLETLGFHFIKESDPYLIKQDDNVVFVKAGVMRVLNSTKWDRRPEVIAKLEGMKDVALKSAIVFIPIRFDFVVKKKKENFTGNEIPLFGMEAHTGLLIINVEEKRKLYVDRRMLETDYYTARERKSMKFAKANICPDLMKLWNMRDFKWRPPGALKKITELSPASPPPLSPVVNSADHAEVPQHDDTDSTTPTPQLPEVSDCGKTPPRTTSIPFVPQSMDLKMEVEIPTDLGATSQVKSECIKSEPIMPSTSTSAAVISQCEVDIQIKSEVKNEKCDSPEESMPSNGIIETKQENE